MPKKLKETTNKGFCIHFFYFETFKNLTEKI